MDAKAHTRPQITPEEALRSVVDRFSLKVTRAKELPSELGLRFLLQEETLERKYILDVAHAEEDPEILRCLDLHESDDLPEGMRVGSRHYDDLKNAGRPQE